MSRRSLARLVSIGRKVDPIILDALARGSPSEFLPLLNYHFLAGGKRMRAALVILSCMAVGGSIQDALRPASAIEMVHNYSLVMDDLIDRGKVRRGSPTLRVVAGDSTSLLVAMYYREVLDDLLQTSPKGPMIRRTLVQAMKDIIDGERLDLLFEQAGRDEPYLASRRLTHPNFGQYLTMIGKKTAALFKAAAEIGGEAAGAKANAGLVRHLGEFGWNSGLAFQIMDDVLDICGNKTGKESAKDVVEHKLGNAAILVALRYMSSKRKAEILGILGAKRVTRALAERARSLVAGTPAEAECRGIAKTYLQRARERLALLRESEHRRALELLSELVVAREF